MPRFARKVIPDVPYHVVQRASHQEFILDSERLRATMMSMLMEWRERTGVAVGAFVLMGNHVHLAASSPTQDALGQMLGRACAEFSRFRNALLGKRGPNWQGRFWAAPMDAAYAVDAVAYIERNPAAAGLVEDPTDWPWSSAAHHCGLGPKPAIVTADFRPPDVSCRDWHRLLRQPTDERLRSEIKAATSCGRPLGAAEWRADVEAMLGLPPHRPRGRPRKQVAPSPCHAA